MVKDVYRQFLAKEASKYRRLRRKFREGLPNSKRVRLLLIGESPPEGANFFYAGKGFVYAAIKKTMSQVFDLPHSLTSHEILSRFTNLSYFLEDLSNTPLDKLKKVDRDEYQKFLNKGTIELSRRLQDFEHRHLRGIVVFMPELAMRILEARDRAHLSHVPTWILPFPSGEGRVAFVEKMGGIIKYIEGEK